MKMKLKKSIMKTFLQALFLISLFGIYLSACQKNTSATTPGKSTLTVSKQKVKKGEPLLVTANQATDKNVRWSVNPSTNTYLSTTTGDSTNVIFYTPGTYLVSADYYTDSAATTPYDSSSIFITVSDSLYTDSTFICMVVMQAPITAGDVLTLTPVSYTDSAGLILSMHSKDLYGPNYPRFGYFAAADTTNGFNYSINNVLESPCGNITQSSVATGTMQFANLGPGSFDVNIQFNGTNYHGTLLVTSTSCTFTWNYSTGVIITPLQIQKQ